MFKYRFERFPISKVTFNCAGMKVCPYIEMLVVYFLPMWRGSEINLKTCESNFNYREITTGKFPPVERSPYKSLNNYSKHLRKYRNIS